MPQLQVSELQKEMELHFIANFKKTHVISDMSGATRKNMPLSIYKANAVTWIWDEDVVPLSEQDLIDRENIHIYRDVEIWDRSRRERMLSQKRKKLLQRMSSCQRGKITHFKDGDVLLSLYAYGSDFYK